jgi:hypothetical protein
LIIRNNTNNILSTSLLCNYLKNKGKEPKLLIVEDFSIEYVSEESSNSEGPDNEVDGLQQFENFIKSSKAIEILREKLKGLVQLFTPSTKISVTNETQDQDWASDGSNEKSKKEQSVQFHHPSRYPNMSVTIRWTDQTSDTLSEL